MFRQGGNLAARVCESIGSDFFLALAPGWLNLGLREGPGSEGEAKDACRRLVRTLALALPVGGTILDAGNGVGTQDRPGTGYTPLCTQEADSKDGRRRRRPRYRLPTASSDTPH